MIKKLLAAALMLTMLLSLAACGGNNSTASDSLVPAPGTSLSDDSSEHPETTAPAPQPEPEPEPEPEPVVEEYVILDPTVEPEGGVRDGVTYVAYHGIVEHLFFHPIIAYPELAFDGDYKSDGLDDWMVTADEFWKILESVYANGYVLVDIADVWSETTDENGNAVMVKNTLYLPEGKKPVIFTYDDVNYYEYMLTNGFTHKLILDENGHIRAWGLDPDGNEVVSRELDAVTALDLFIEQHPDFSPFGAKACMGLTGYEGILGYRTQTETEGWTAEKEAARQKEIEAVKPIIEELKRTGWTFASHTWGHIRLSGSYDRAVRDTELWFAEVGSLIGETPILLYPHGDRPDGNDWTQTGETFRYLHGKGFRILCSVGIESFTAIKKEIAAVICDRMHPDGTTLRSASCLERYMKFYDAREIIDLNVRPERAVGWME